MQVLLVLGLGGDPLTLQTFPPGKLTSLEFNIIEENEPLGLFELLPTTGVDYTVVSNEQFPVGDHEPGAASIVNTPLDPRNWRDRGLHEEEKEFCFLADLQKLS